MKSNLAHGFSICTIIRNQMETSCRILFQYFMCSPAGCMGLVSIKKQIERDEEIAEKLQDGNKSNRGAESQDS